MSYLTQMAGLTVHNFVSAATGIALAVALVRGFARRSAQTIGNFWVDLTRCVLYILLPISIVVGLVFVWQGMPQNLGAYTEATTLEGAKQLIAQGPVASQEVIKILGTNGGGFFNANSAHPFENPNALTNFIQIAADLLDRCRPDQPVRPHGRRPAPGLGDLRGDGHDVPGRRGHRLFGREPGQPGLRRIPCRSEPRQTAAAQQAGGNMEGKEVRFGIANSSLFATITTDTSCGAVNTMHDSLLPLAGAVPLANMMFGCIFFGGVGSGLYGMLLFVIVAMFVAGLMVGRTPEYLGKKLEAKEVKMAMLAILVLSMSILGFTALAVVLPVGTGAMANAGPHGFSEALYGYASATANNGSAFAGLSANVPFWNTTLGLAMFIGRFMVIDADAGGGGFAGEEEDRAGLGRHVPHPQPAVRRPGDRRDHHHRRVDLLPGRRARPDRRAVAMHAGTLFASGS